MRILYLTPAFHHPSMRGPTRCYHFARELSKRHQVTLLSLTTEPVLPEALEEMQGRVERVEIVEVGGARTPRSARILGRLPGVGPRLAAEACLRDAVRRAKERFQRLVAEGFDVVLFHGKCLAPLLDGFDVLPVVIDFCDATSLRVRGNLRRAPWWRRPLLALRWLQVRRVERRLLRTSPHLAFVSQRDREAVLGPQGGGQVVTIGVDHGFWRRQGPPGPDPRIVFSGIMSYAPNDDAARILLERILPRVREVFPEAQLQILGRDPSPELRRLAEQSPDAEATGFVRDMRPHLERAWLEAVPLRYGAGVQNKILEAMAMELPVVTTSLARDGLRVETGEEPPVEVADGEQEFAERVIKLLEQPGERARLAAAGRRYVERHYDWAGSAERLERLCLEAVDTARARRRNRA